MHLLRRGFTALVAGTFLVATASAAYAGTITSPTGNPFVVPGDAAGNPVAVTVTANGFTPGSLAYLEQCDGVATTSPGWSPTANCDLGSSQAPALVDGTGTATFPASDPNRGFTPFKGESPQSLFNCLSPSAPASSNGLPDFRNCKLRASSSNTNVTADQAFVNIQLPDAVASSTNVGSCSGVQMLGKVDPPLAGAPTPVVASPKTAKSGLKVHDASLAGVTTTTGNASCTILGATDDTMQVSAKLSGVGSCDSASTNPALYPLNGKLGLKNAAKTVVVSGYVRVAGYDPSQPDVIVLTGILTKGPGAGASVSGSVFFDPVIKAGTADPNGIPKNEYYFDVSQIGAPCGTGGNPIALVYSGDGTSLLGSTADGLSFDF